MQRPRFFLRRAALIMALLLFALPARALDLSRDELRALFSSLTDAESDALFAETPSIEPPYAAGMLNDEQIDSALGTLNVLRALAGLPEVTGDDELNDIAQHGAVLSAARGEITHAPEPVAGMPDDFYALGAAARTENGALTFGERVELARLWSANVEYSEENMRAVLGELT